MIQIYGIQSGNVAKVRAALIFKGLEFEHVSVNLGTSKEFAELAPIRKMPVIKDSDGTVVWESSHIIDYLDTKYPETYRMIPADPKERARVLNVIALVDYINDLLLPLFVAKFDMSENYAKSGRAHKSEPYTEQGLLDVTKDVVGKLQKLEEMLDGKEYFVEKFSAADAVVLGNLINLSVIDIPKNEALQKWMDELMKDEKISQMMAPKEEKGVKEI